MEIPFDVESFIEIIGINHRFTIDEFIPITKLNINRSLLDKLWLSLSSDLYPITIDENLKEWLGVNDIPFEIKDEISTDDFKEVVMCLGSKKIKKEYMVLEKLVRLYTEYCDKLTIKIQEHRLISKDKENAELISIAKTLGKKL